MRYIVLAAVLMAGCLLTPPALAKLSLRTIVETLFAASPDVPVDFSNADMSFLDLSSVDFKRARLNGAKLHGSDLTDANLSHASLQHATLDRATLVRTNFSGANMNHALIRLPHSAGRPDFDKSATPSFHRSNLENARLVGRFDGGDFRHANLAGANLGPHGDWTQNTLTRRSLIISGNFAKANLARANLTEAILTFSNFTDANLRHVNFTDAILISVDFSGADLSQANVAGADFEGANLRFARGLETVVGKHLAKNWPTTLGNND